MASIKFYSVPFYHVMTEFHRHLDPSKVSKMESLCFCGLNEVPLGEIKDPNKKGENPKGSVLFSPVEICARVNTISAERGHTVRTRS